MNIQNTKGANKMTFPIRFEDNNESINRRLSELKKDPKEYLLNLGLSMPVEKKLSDLTEADRDEILRKEYGESLARERKKLQEFMDDYEKAESLVVFRRHYVHPVRTNIRFSPSDAREMNIDQFLHQLNFSEERFTEIFEWNPEVSFPNNYWGIRENYLNGDNSGSILNGFTGKWTSNGRQRLADIIGKEIRYHRHQLGGGKDLTYVAEPEAVCKPTPPELMHYSLWNS